MSGIHADIDHQEAHRSKIEDTLDDQTAKASGQAVNESDADSWPQPGELPGSLPPVPAFDADLLPESLRPWITDISERIQCPPDYPAIGAMVALGSVVGRQLGIRPRVRDDWTVVPNLWGAIIGRPGLLKTPALAEVMRPLKNLETQAKETYEAEKRQYDANTIIEKAEAKQTEQSIKKAIKDGDRARAEYLAAQSMEESAKEPIRRRYVTSDTTVEALGELLAANPRGVLIHRDELTGWLRDLDKPGREGSRAFYLEAWNGTGSYTYDRIGRGTIDIEAACVSVIGSIQPGPLSAYLREAMDGGAGDDGLLQRLQMAVWPDTTTHWREVDRWPDSEAQRTASEVFDRLDVLDPETIGAHSDGELPYLRLDETAQETFRDWRTALEERLRSNAEHPAFEAVLAKYRSLVPSLALITHLADAPNGGPVTETAVLRAITWAEFLEEHARRIYAPALDPALYAARELDRHIKNGDLGRTFKARDVYMKCWRALDRRGTEEALAYLADLDRVVEQQIPPGANGGRPTTVWHLNPRIEVAS